MKKTILFTFALLLATGLYAQNLLSNGSFDKPLTGETRIKNNAGWSLLKIYTEDTTWNKAARLTVTQIHLNQKNGHKSFLAWFFIGGDGKKLNSTFKLKPNTNYRYSFRLKTNIKPEQAAILCRIGTFGPDASIKKQLAKTAPLKHLNEKTWTTISGTFHSGNETEALILIPIYSDTQYGEKMLMKVGNWLMIDDVKVEEIPDLPTTGTAEKKTTDSGKDVYESGKIYRNFRTLKSNLPPAAETSVSVTAEKNAFRVILLCKNPDLEKIRNQKFSDFNNPWKDADLAEIFFVPENAQKPIQFAFSVNGAKWTSIPNGNNASSWNANITVEAGFWKVEAVIPYQLLGYTSMPEEILFFAARERNHVQEFSSLTFQEKSFHAVENYGILINIPFQKWIAVRKNELFQLNKKLRKKSYLKQIEKIKFTTPVKVYAEIQSLKKKIHFSILEEQKIIVSLPLPGADFHLPYIPQKFLSENESIKVFAAGNELYPLPVMISNLSGKTEEYRITIEHLDHKKCERYGLLGKDGAVLGRENIEIFRGIRSRVSDQKDTREFFDGLVSLGNTGTITIPARESALIWVRINTKGKTAGTYTGTLRINPLSVANPHHTRGNTMNAANAVQTKTIPFSLEIYPFELAEKNVVPFHGFSNPAFSAACLPVLDEIGLNGFMLTPHMLRAEFDERGHLTKYWIHPNQAPVLTRTMELLKEKIRRKECFFLIGYGSYHTFYHNILQKKFPEGSREWRTAWSEWIGAFDKVLAQYGITREMYSHELWDEPDAKKVGHIMKPVAQIISQDHPGIRKTITLTPYISLCRGVIDCAPFVDEFIIYDSTNLTDYKTKGIDYIAELKKAGAKLSVYKCAVDNGTPAYSYYRCYPWRILNENLDALSLYTAVSGWFDGGHDWRCMGGGNWLLRSFDDVIRTVRSDTLLIGFNDIKYMKLLKQLAETSKDKKLAQECLDFYRKTVAEVIRNSHDPAYIPSVRQKIADYIIRLQSSTAK